MPKQSSTPYLDTEVKPIRERNLVILEYLIVLIYLILLVLEGVAEAYVLRRLNWTTWPKALIGSWLSNLIGFIVGFSIAFVTVGVTFALAWDGTISKLPYGGAGVGVGLVVAAISLPVLSGLLKWLILWLLSVGKGQRLWLFSFVAAVLFWIVPLVITIMIGKIIF